MGHMIMLCTNVLKSHAAPPQQPEWQWCIHPAWHNSRSCLHQHVGYFAFAADFESSSRLLPPLASSLAYSNYSQWRASHTDQDLPEVTPGVTLSDLYKAAEREVSITAIPQGEVKNQAELQSSA